MKTNLIQLVLIVLITMLTACTSENNPPYKNPELGVDVRVDDLVSRMTIEEKVSQMSHLAPAIERLGVVAYDPNFDNPYIEKTVTEEDLVYRQNRPWENHEHWEGGCQAGGYWNEAIHGVGRAGLATQFPQVIALGSTWNPELIQKMSDVASSEARIHNNVYGKKLTYWSPTINILRDPRWGRNEESYSEDPYLLSRMAVAFVKGFQGDDPRYLKAVATAKHFAANNSEYNRHTGSSDVSERWLREYYLPAFKAAVTEAGVESIMSAYNRVNGTPASANSWLLDDVLRNEWGFKGHVVSDCGAVSDVVTRQKYEDDPEKAVAMTAKAGTDLECETCGLDQFYYDKYLLSAYNKGYIAEEDIDKNVKRVFRARFLLGEFDPPENVPFTKIPKEELDSKEHRQLALEVARESIVLLKNARLPGQEDKTLPLDANSIRRIAVIGPNANKVELGGYSGTPSVSISPLDGIRTKLEGKAEVVFEQGCSILGKEYIGWDEEKNEGIYNVLDEKQSIKDAAALAASSDVAVVVLGTDLSVADEHADAANLNLPGNQLELVQKVTTANENTIVVLINGIALTTNWIDENVPAVVEAWYAGQAGGTAIADVLFGDYNPGGKLPVTFYKEVESLPHLGDYDITKGRTYWFNEAEPLYPFGHGLSYTTFAYDNLTVEENSSTTNAVDLNVSVEINNSGDVTGDEVVQLYVRDTASSVIQPIKRLRAFERVALDPGETKKVSFELKNEDFSYWDESKKDWSIEAGEFEIMIGSSSEDIRLKASLTIN